MCLSKYNFSLNYGVFNFAASVPVMTEDINMITKVTGYPTASVSYTHLTLPTIA